MYAKWKKVTEDEVRAVIEPALADKKGIPYAVPTGDGVPMPIHLIVAEVILKNGQSVKITILPNEPRE